MKINLWRSSLFLLLLTLIAGCGRLSQSKHYTIYLKPSDTNQQMLQTAASVINKRLETVYDNKVVAHVKENLILLELHEKVNVKGLLSLVLAKGSFSMHEVHTRQEMLRRIITIDPDLAGVGFLNMRSADNGASIGEAARYDTTEIIKSETLNALTKQYDDVHFMWGAETSQESIPLYGLKKTTTTPILDNLAIKTAKLDYNDRGEESVFVELKEDFHDAWLLMTRKNIGRSIAIQLDDQVLSAPLVYSEIPEGKLFISGGLKGRARILAALISADVLPISLSVSSIDPELKHSSKRSYPTESQINKYNVLRAQYLHYRYGIDSLLMQARAGMDITSMRRELARVYHEDLPTIVDQVGLTEEQVDQFLDKASGTLEGLKLRLDPNAVQTPQSLFDSLAAIVPGNPKKSHQMN